MKSLDQRPYFFDDGIRFACRRCGACCTGAPGVVRVDEPWENGHSIKENPDGSCLFFRDGCRIYPVRPRQCRTFPFWFANLRSQARWESIRSECPGIGTGRLYTKTDILDILSRSCGRSL
jgi:Fe-S-cluster containining protein